MVIRHDNIHAHHHRKFYILMATVVVGAILILLLLNDDGNFIFLTGSSIGVQGMGEENTAGEGNINFKLNFDSVPGVKEQVEFESMGLVFDDLTSKIKVNEEELELKNLKEVEMDVEGFKGDIDFNEISISLKGEADKVIVNGMEISSQGKPIQISFSGLVYKTLNLSEIGLKAIEFKEGKGELMSEGKMDYILENEAVKVQKFKGDIAVGLDKESLLVLEGKVNSFSTQGEFDLSFN